MNAYRCLLICLLLLIACRVQAQETNLAELAKQEKLTSQILYPLAEGSKWTYTMTVNGKPFEMQFHVAKLEKIDEKTLFRVETNLNGKFVATEHFSQTDHGLARDRYNGIELKPGLLLLRNPVKLDEKRKSEITVAKQALTVNCETTLEKVETPAGKFSSVKLSVATIADGVAVDSDYWFAPGVGIVQQTLNLGNVKAKLKLKKYEPGPKKQF